MKRDNGFTLIELLVAVAILGVITVALAGSIVGYLRNSGATTAKLAESHDIQVAAAYWAQDVAGVGTRATSSPYALNQSVDDTGSASWPYPCTLAGATSIVRLVWDDYPNGPGAPTQTRVAYVTETVGAQYQLHRLMCSGSATPSTDATLAHDLTPGTPPTVACLAAAGATSCIGSGSQVPQSITLTLTVRDPNDTTGPNYVVTLSGTRRQT